MEATPQTAEEIRRRMQRTRQRVRAEVDEVVQDARQLADWRYYPERFPWATLSAALVLGYAAIPRRLEVIAPNADTVEELARRHKLVVSTKPVTGAGRGVLDLLLAWTGKSLLRAGMAYMGQHVSHLVRNTVEETPA